ncbi:MAG: dCTP deaminase [Patescibacteria group bacterium]
MPKKSQKKVLQGKPAVTTSVAKAMDVKKVLVGKEAERVMVVSRTELFDGEIWNGIRSENLPKYLKVITKSHKFMARGEVESDPKWKQVIPYLIFEAGGKILAMQRKGTHTDKRLANMYSIGVGGHINLKDVKGIKSIKGIKGDEVMEWAKREFEEEIDYKGKYTAKFLGILNHDANDVGLVHVGLVIMLSGDSSEINVRDEHKSGTMMTVDELGRHFKKMETWSQIVYDHMVNKRQAISKKQQETRDKQSFSTNKQSFSANKQQENSKNMTGILPDWLIEEAVEKGDIKISPLPANWKDNIDQVSIDFHLGGNIKLFRSGAYRFIDTRRGLPEDAMEEINLTNGDPFILEPGAFAIASTSEVLKLAPDILGRLEGKSSLARLGILVHSTAARFDPGWNGAPVLELGNLGPKPAILYCGMPICAFTFEKLAAPVKMKYEGSRSDRYSGSRLAVASKIDKATNGKK